MPFTHAFNAFELVIKISFALFSVMTVLLIAALILIRSRNAMYRSHQITLTRRWREIFKAAYTGDVFTAQLPPISRNDWFTVLAVYIQFHDIREKDRSRSKEVFARLDALAARIGIGDYALSLLQRGDDADKILALEILGHLRDVRAFELASALTDEKGTELSRSAAHCALRIDSTYIASALQLVLVRDDWVRSRVETMLAEVEPETLGAAMLEALLGAPDELRHRLLAYLRLCPALMARAMCTAVLSSSRDAETIAAALRALVPLASDRDHDLAVRYVTHEEPIVTLSALRVLRNCVLVEDRDLLVKMLSHPDYWVRLRAAEAAVQLMGSVEAAQTFAQTLDDRYSRDAIRQVLAEKTMGAPRLPRQERRADPAIVGTA